MLDAKEFQNNMIFLDLSFRLALLHFNDLIFSLWVTNFSFEESFYLCFLSNIGKVFIAKSSGNVIMGVFKTLLNVYDRPFAKMGKNLKNTYKTTS